MSRRQAPTRSLGLALVLAILLPASAAALGMIPIAPTVFWGPMAYSIIGGLAVATVLTLIFLPALYVAWFRIKEPATQTVGSLATVTA